MGALRTLVIAAGLLWSVLFVVAGLRSQLQLYGDGAIFSYAVAVRDVWAFHWHNIPVRLAVYVLCLAPAEFWVWLTNDAAGGITVYGLLFFMAPLAGLAATFALDRTPGRTIFAVACFSTAVLCPLVFGFPTEMWLAHALFWPAFAISHDPRRRLARLLMLLVMMQLLVLAHEGGVVLAGLIVLTLSLHGLRDGGFQRVLIAFAVSMAVWIAVKLSFPPDPYVAEVMARAAGHFFDPVLLESPLLLLLAATLAGCGLVFLLVHRLFRARATVLSVVIVAAALAVYWLVFDHALHAESRYFLRTVLLVGVSALAVLSALPFSPHGSGGRYMQLLRSLIETAARCPITIRAITSAFVLVMLVHAVETVKFISAWTRYQQAITALATGEASDPALGDPRFVSSARVGASLNRLSWFSTTPYLSVILAGFTPKRLVVDPAANYFWLPCDRAAANARVSRAIPASSRELIRVYSCQHR